MNQFFSQREIQAMIALLNRTPLTAAEQLYAETFLQRLTALCQPPETRDELNEEVVNGPNVTDE